MTCAYVHPVFNRNMLVLIFLEVVVVEETLLTPVRGTNIAFLFTLCVLQVLFPSLQGQYSNLYYQYYK